MERSLHWLASCLLGCLVLLPSTGCSSLGVSIWPAQFPLLKSARQMADMSPLPSGLPHELAKTELAQYYLEPGDRILIEPTKLDSALGNQGDQKIQIDGTVDLGRFGRIRVAGMTVEQTEQAIQQQLAALGTPETINVQMVETNAAEVYVIGEVGSPAAYPIEGHEHVLDAILRAGGLTSQASPCDIILVRPTAPGECRVVLPVCYRQITQLGDVTTNYQLQPGDRIVVSPRTLSEELRFWKQQHACERCCQSSGVNCQPGTVQYQNRFAAAWAAFQTAPAPSTEPAAQDADPSPTPDRPGIEPQPESQPSPTTPSDAEVFIPPIKTGG